MLHAAITMGTTVARLLSGLDNEEYRMAQKVADVMWEMLATAGVKRCYGNRWGRAEPGDRRAAAQRQHRVYPRSS